MGKFLAKCIEDTTIQGINVGSVYQIKHDVDYKVIYNETETTFDSVVGNKEWFREHFRPINQ